MIIHKQPVNYTMRQILHAFTKFRPPAQRLLSLLVSLALLLAPLGSRAAYASTPLDVGYLDFNYTGYAVADPTGEKPESKLWWHDGWWWASMFNPAAGGDGEHHIYRLDWGTQSWLDTGVVLDERNDSKADVLWDGAKLYVVSHVFTMNSTGGVNTGNSGRLYRYSYNAALETYTPDAGFGSSVLVNGDRTETLVLDKDSNSRLWVGYVSRPQNTSDYQVYVNASAGGGLANDDNWGTPFSLGDLFTEAHVMTDDLASLVAFGTQIGVMWSNQNTGTLHFATHDDTNADITTGWTLNTAILPVPNDDHISIKSLRSTSSGQVFAAVKGNTSISTDPLVGLVARDSDGTLSYHAYSTKADDDTRPSLLIDETTNKIYLFVTGKPGGSKICYKTLDITSPLASMGDFPAGNCGTELIADATYDNVDNATSTKEKVNATTGIVVLASDEINGEYYVHNVLGNPPPVVTARFPDFNATLAPITTTVSATFSKPMNQSTLTNARFTVVGPNGAVNGTRSYNTATRTWTFTPSGPLRARATYTVTIVKAVEDTSGLELNGFLGGTNETWSFTTGDPTVQLSSTDYSVNEGDGTATITATLNVSSTVNVRVNYATSDGSANAGSDYTSASGQLTFSPGQTSQTFTVPITDDGVGTGTDEPNETVNLTLSNPISATLGLPITGTLTIVDDDGTPSVQFNPAAFEVDENGGTATINVSLSNASLSTLTVDYATTASGTATAGSDFLPTSGTLTFAPMDTSETFTVTVLDNSLNEADETVGLELSNPLPGGSIEMGTPSTALLTIHDDDPLPTVEFITGAYSVNEVSGTATITARLNVPSGQQVTVEYATSDITAQAGSDYTTASGTITFTPGVTTTTFTVPITDDVLDEPDEAIGLTLSNPGNAVLGLSEASLTIVDNDAEPTVQFSTGSYSVSETGATATITVTLSAPSAKTVEVDYATSNGSATSGSDYASASGTLSFAPGVTTQTFTVTLMDDTLPEGPETVILTLSNPDDATLGPIPTATLVIFSDEIAIYMPIIRR